MSRKKIVMATNNAHKLQEAREILADSDWELVSLSDLGCHEDIPETGATLEENALQKAQWVASRYGVDCFADDTGLEVYSLGGEPGVRSARYAGGEGHDSQANMKKLLQRLEGSDDRRARFRTVIALILDGKVQEMDGVVEGSIRQEPSGVGGFGYDPVFEPIGYAVTFAQMSAEEKNSISHRGRAMAKLKAILK
ncbi:MAG: RdgB/HAM1 family non-canonical purine NTP pyrophosphatase [Bacteroidales bacterium]|nr:RdgB/HAM1 family non-canonical purine NTP pyrophosphatase [Bacteroidales bacterium]